MNKSFCQKELVSCLFVFVSFSYPYFYKQQQQQEGRILVSSLRL
jgi:hypothetical protein